MAFVPFDVRFWHLPTVAVRDTGVLSVEWCKCLVKAHEYVLCGDFVSGYSAVAYH
jgi:hypothetical protein